MNTFGKEIDEIIADIGFVEVGKPIRTFTVFDKLCRPSEDLTVPCSCCMALVLGLVLSQLQHEDW